MDIRGAALIGVGAWLDTYVWGLYPFLSMDVLYLIGVSMPLCYLVGKLPVGLRVALTIQTHRCTTVCPTLSPRWALLL